jgi:uncharacterized protein YaaW (UPF0174 family)
MNKEVTIDGKKYKEMSNKDSDKFIDKQRKENEILEMRENLKESLFFPKKKKVSPKEIKSLEKKLKQNETLYKEDIEILYTYSNANRLINQTNNKDTIKNLVTILESKIESQRRVFWGAVVLIMIILLAWIL